MIDKSIRMTAALLAAATMTTNAVAADLSPAAWPKGEYDQWLNEGQSRIRTQAGVATGKRGAVTVAYNGLAARAGLRALEEGGNAIDAALTTALMQVALTGGAPISYFGIMSLVYYDAKSGKTYVMDAGWDTVAAETDPLSIPGAISFATEDGLLGSAPSGRTAMVGGFMKGVGSAHARFGKLPWKQIFEPSIHVAEHGMPVTERFAHYIDWRSRDLARLPETRAVFTKSDGSFYRQGDLFKQPALAGTLRKVAEQGADYMYKGGWAKKTVAAVQADGGKMTLEDLSTYEPIWSEAIEAEVGDYVIKTAGAPNVGGVGLVEAQNLAIASGLTSEPHWTKSGASLRKAIDIASLYSLNFYPPQALAQMYPGIDFSPQARLTLDHARKLWAAQARLAGATPGSHSDDVVAVDAEGNMAAITHSINCVIWGKTAIMVDGVSIGDPASFQQPQMAQVKPGERLPGPTETGILFKDGQPVLAFASMGSGLHQRTFQGLMNVMVHGMTVDEAIDTADFYNSNPRGPNGAMVVGVPAGRFPKAVLDDMGLPYEELEGANARFGGEGIWVAISRDHRSGDLRAASHNRNNSAAVAY